QVATRLCRHFLADDPPPDCVLAAATRFLETRGDLREATRAVLFCDSFLAGFGRGERMKRPLHYVASIGRALPLESNSTYVEAALASMARMGEELYFAAAPSGYPDTSDAWTGEGAFIERLNFAHFAANGRNGVRPQPRIDAPSEPMLELELQRRLPFAVLGEAMRSLLRRHVPTIPASPTTLTATESATLVFAGPDFMVY